MPTNAEVALVFKAIDQTKGTIKAVQDDLRGVGQGVGALSTAMKGLAAIGGMAAVIGAGKAAFDLAEMGAAALRTEAAFANVARRVGASGDAIVTAMKAAAAGTIDDTDLMQAAMTTMNMKVTGSAEELGLAMEYARLKARETGADTLSVFDSIVDGVSRMSMRHLYNAQIVIDEEAAYAAYATQIGKVAGELTDAEKRAALWKETLGRAKTELAEAGGVANDAVDDFQRMKVAIDESKESLGKLLAGPVTWMASQVTTASNVIAGGFVPQIGSMIAGLDNAAAALLTGDDVARAYAEGVYTAAAAMGLLKDETAEAIPVMREWLGLLASEKTITALRSGYTLAAEIKPFDWEAARLEPGGAFAAPSPQESVRAFQDQLDWLRRKASADDEERERRVREEEAAADEVRRAWTTAYGAVRSRLDTIMQPTQAWGGATGLRDSLGMHKDTWDEEARRMADVAARGKESPWFAAMKMDPALTQEQARLTAAEWIDAFYQGLHPEAVNEGAVIDAYQKLVAGEKAQEAMKQGIMGKLGGAGAVNQELLDKALGKEQFGDKLFGSLSGGLEKSLPVMQTGGERMVDTLITSALKRADESEFMVQLVNMLVPRVAAELDRQESNRHPGSPVE